MLSAVRTTAYSVIAVGGRRSGASRCAATPRPRPLLEHFSLNQLCQLDATAYEPIHPALATARIVLAWRMSISSQAGAAVSRNVALGATPAYSFGRVVGSSAPIALATSSTPWHPDSAG